MYFDTISRLLLATVLLIGLLKQSDAEVNGTSDLGRDRQEELKRFEKCLERSLKGGNAKNCSALGLEAERWANQIDEELGQRLGNATESQWNYLTNLTDENARKNEAVLADIEPWYIDVINKANYYLDHPMEMCNATTYRMLRLIIQFNTVPPAKNATTRQRINRLLSDMEQIYGTSNVTRNGTVYNLGALSNILATSRDYDELLWAWGAWHNTTGRKMKEPYEELVDKMNEAATDNGFPDIGLYWKYSDYDDGDIESEMDELFDQLLPFYEQLHAYVRRRLADRYENVDRTGFIPAHLLGNMWAQQWDSIDDILLPFPNASSNYDVTQALVDQGYTPDSMFRLAEQFFVSIGLEPMTPDFWNKSIIVQPEDNRPFECHAAAFDFFSDTDFRIKMCTEVTAEDLETIHHEMGHIEYFMQYRHQPSIFRTGANAAFHEAIGDTIALSFRTNTHLAVIGLIPANYSQLTSTELYEQEINTLMRSALLKIAFLPFGYVVDKWRFKVFRGEITPDNYTSSWWKMREFYGGITAPIPRTSEDFDPGAKYHIPANVPYSRYFFSFVGQFQFHSALCRAAGHQGLLHTCDIYRSIRAGNKLRSVLRLGASRPWPETLFRFTGQKKFRADAIIEYFKPLFDWLKNENKGHPIGWQRAGERP